MDLERGDYAACSDYDVALMLNEVNDERKILIEARRLKPQGLPLDLVVLSADDLEGPVVGKMLNSCIVLYDGVNLPNKLNRIDCRSLHRPTHEDTH